MEKDWQSTFLVKFDQVLDLIQHGQLQQDIDDTLLQKLITFLHCGTTSSNASEIDELQQDYQKAIYKKIAVHGHVETFLSEVLKRPLCIKNPQACVFGFQLLSVLTEGGFNLLLQENKLHILRQLSDLVKECLADASPSVQVAALHCLSCIAQHQEGFLWLADQDLLDVGLKYLGATSLYVRKSAVEFVSSCLVVWCQFFSTSTKPNITMKKVLHKLLQNVTVEDVTEQQKFVKDSCIKILKEAMKQESKVGNCLAEEFCLLDIVHNTIDVSTDLHSVQSVVDLTLSLFECQGSRNSDFETTVEGILIRHEHLEVLMNFISFILDRYYTQHQEWSQKQLAVILSPLIAVTGVQSVSPSPEVNELVQKKITDKDTCRKLVRISLLALSKLISRLENQVFNDVIAIVTHVLQPNSDQWHKFPLQRHIAGCKKTRSAACQLLISCVQPSVRNQLESSILSSVMNTFLFLLNSATSDSQLLSQSIQGLSTLAVQQRNEENWLSPVVLDQLAEVMHRRLADTRWAVVDSALQLLDCLSDQDIAANQSLVHWLCHHKFPCVVWDIVHSEVDGYVKATAVSTLCSFCLVPSLWTYLKEQKDCSERVVVWHFLKLVMDDSDTFVRRAAISSLLRLLQVGVLDVRTKHISDIYKVLMTISTSELDWEVKLHSLKVWHWVAEQNVSLLHEKSHDVCSTNAVDVNHKIINLLKKLYACGYGISLVTALGDHDRTVQQQAAEYLLDLCQHLENLGWTNQLSLYLQKDFSISEDVIVTGSRCNEVLENEMNMPAVNRTEILEQVLDMDTLNQIQQIITKTPESCESNDIFVNSKCDLKHDNSHQKWVEFIQALAKKQLEAMLLNLSKSTDVYSNEPVSLLEDIISSSSAVSNTEDFKAMDCY